MPLHDQEDFIIDRFKELESELPEEVKKPHDATFLIIILFIRKVFKKYESLPDDSTKYILIRQEFDRMKIFEQIKTHYGNMGLKFVDFMKGLLDNNYAKAVEHTNLMLGNEETLAPEYEEPASVNGWLGESAIQGVEMVGLILVLLSQKKSVEEIVPAIQKLSEGQAYKATRLARTETAQILNDTALSIYALSGVTKVRWTDATEKLVFRSGKKRITKICSRCREYATGGEGGKGIYPINQLPSPCPAHPNCRCTIIPL